MPFVNQENVTVPVGAPRLPVTVAWSCTVVPAGTDVTTLSSASWIRVTGGRERLDDERFTCTDRTCVGAITGVGRLERKVPGHTWRLDEVRAVGRTGHPT